MAFEPVHDPRPSTGVISEIGELLPRLRGEIARLIDVEQAAVELLRRAVVAAHDRGLTDIRAGQLLANQDDERAAGEIRALMRRAGIQFEREERNATVNAAVEVLRAAGQGRPA
jgi:hypothetical protein